MKTTKISICLLACFTLLFSCSQNDNWNPSTDNGNNNDNGNKETPSTVEGNHVVAHRGACKEFGLPYNSRAALRKAIELGCFASEMDIQLTKDLKVVVYHDDNYHGRIFKDHTYDELAGIAKLANGETLPLLEEFLDIIMDESNYNNTLLWVDVKSISDEAGGNAWSSKAGEEAAKVIKAKGAQKNVEYIVGRIAVANACAAAVKGEWNIAYMDKSRTPDNFYKTGFRWANFELSAFYPDKGTLIKDFQKLGIQVSVYNADTDAQMDYFLKQDLYAICTNYPYKLLKKMEKLQ